MRVTLIEEVMLGLVLGIGLMFVSACDRTDSSTTDSTHNSLPAVQAGPGTIAFVSGERLWTMNEYGGARRALTREKRTVLAAAPAWSPDGRRIAFETLRRDYKSEIYVVNADGTGERRVGQGSTPKWLPDGRITASRCDWVCVMNADGTGRRRMRIIGRFPLWSPDGRKIALARGRNEPFGGARFALTVLSADGTSVRRVTDYGAVTPGAWSPDGRRVAFVQGAVIDPDIYGDAEIWAANADGTNLRQLTHNDDPDVDPAWSPDGRQIAFLRGRPRSYEIVFEIYVMDADGQNQRRLTRDSVRGHSPAWSPDGQKIAFVNGSGTAEEGPIYVVNVDGSNQGQIAQNASHPTWQPALVRKR